MHARLTLAPSREYFHLSGFRLRYHPQGSRADWGHCRLFTLAPFGNQSLFNTSDFKSNQFPSDSRSFPLGIRTFRTMATNGEPIRPKRKQSPVAFLDRPTKHLKPEASAPTPGDRTPQNGTIYNVEGEVKPAPVLNPLSAPDSPEWQATIERVVKSVVSIHFCQTCAFDTDLSSSSQATGFIVDAERGYIMTNRHVVCAGPFWGYCIFDNHEEVGRYPCLVMNTN